MSSLSENGLTWQQVVLCGALLATVIVAHQLLGELPAGLFLVISGIVNLLLGRRVPTDAALDARSKDRRAGH